MFCVHDHHEQLIRLQDRVGPIRLRLVFVRPFCPELLLFVGRVAIMEDKRLSFSARFGLRVLLRRHVLACVQETRVREVHGRV